MKATIGKKKREAFVSKGGVEFHYMRDLSGQVTIYVRNTLIVDIPADALMEFCQKVCGVKLGQTISE